MMAHVFFRSPWVFFGWSTGCNCFTAAAAGDCKLVMHRDLSRIGGNSRHRVYLFLVLFFEQHVKLQAATLNWGQVGERKVYVRLIQTLKFFFFAACLARRSPAVCVGAIQTQFRGLHQKSRYKQDGIRGWNQMEVGICLSSSSTALCSKLTKFSQSWQV
jgi:hypothetical protein